MFRWQYFLPRLTVVAAIALTVRYGLDPFLRWALVTAGEAATGARVDVGDLVTSLRDGELVITGFAAANPQKPLRNWFDAEQLRLQIDMAQLLRKRVVVHDGAIQGLQFDSPRATSGVLDNAPVEPGEPSALDPMMQAAQANALGWFHELASRSEADLMAALATPRLLDELQQRWPRQYDDLKSRAAALRAKSKQIETAFREAKKNPLRNLQALDQLRQELAATESELRSTLAEIQGLPKQAAADRLAVDAARKKDEQFMREHLKPAAINGNELNQYLLGETAHGYLAQTTYWIAQVRKFVPKKRIAPPARTRGTFVLFNGVRQPRLLIETLSVAGRATLSGAPLEFSGSLVDVASEPELHDKPVRLVIRTTGAVDGRVEVQLDRREGIAKDWASIDVPELMLAPRTVGKNEKLAVTIGGGKASIKAHVTLTGDHLDGLIELRQAASLEAATPGLRDDRLAAVLHESLANVDRLEATVRLAGTLKRPEFEIDSNVGPQLAAGIKGAVGRYLADRQQRLTAKVQQRVDAELAKLESLRQEAQKELLAGLGEDQQMLSQLAGLMGGTPSLDGLSLPQLGKSISLDKLTR
jgi:uncharacterized protein (TIGR03545 family)